VLAWSLHAESATTLTAMSDNFFNILAVPIIDLARIELRFLGHKTPEWLIHDSCMTIL
jgi:membrane-bound lytic murein transglycosylase MltF